MKEVLKTIYWGVTLTLVLAKVGGDMRRHATHPTHSQNCTCMTQCVKCIVDTLKTQRPASSGLSETLADYLRKFQDE